MINSIYYSNYSPCARTSFCSRTTPPAKTLKQELNNFANKLSLLQSSELYISKKLIPDLPEEVNSVKIQLLKPHGKGNERTLNLTIKTSKNNNHSSGEALLRKGSLPQIREHLRNNTTSTLLTEKINSMARGLLEEEPVNGF